MEVMKISFTVEYKCHFAELSAIWTLHKVYNSSGLGTSTMSCDVQHHLQTVEERCIGREMSSAPNGIGFN